MSCLSGRSLLAAILLFHAGAAWPVAKVAAPEEEFARTLKDYREIAPGGEDAFGERIGPAQQTGTWHADGTLASVSDGRDAPGFE